MSMKFLALIVFVYVIGLILGSTFEYNVETPTPAQTAAGAHADAWVGSGSGGLQQSPSTTLGYVMNMKNVLQQQPLLGGAISIPSPNTEYFDAVFKMVTWRFDFLWYDDFGRMFWWVCLMPIVVASVASIILLLYGVLTGNLTW